MLPILKNTNLIIKRTPLLCGLLFTAVLALLPISAGAQCAQWDASGVWEIKQRGLDYGIIVTLQQNGRVLIGSANISTNLNYGPVNADGTIDGDSLSLQIFWQDGSVGVYNAKFLPSGRLDGTGYEKNTPNITHLWHSQNPLKCSRTGPAKPFKLTYKITLPPPHPIKSSGKMPKPAPAAPPPPMKVPGIIASQLVFQGPLQPQGFAVLTWDGGSDHPYAEVWVKVNNGDETFVVEQAKGVRQVTVERGRSYEYILTDAGKTLATVSFIVPR
jgi:hypothetical protein